jgi:hypothetical protein
MLFATFCRISHTPSPGLLVVDVAYSQEGITIHRPPKFPKGRDKPRPNTLAGASLTLTDRFKAGAVELALENRGLSFGELRHGHDLGALTLQEWIMWATDGDPTPESVKVGPLPVFLLQLFVRVARTILIGLANGEQGIGDEIKIFAGHGFFPQYSRHVFTI